MMTRRTLLATALLSLVPSWGFAQTFSGVANQSPYRPPAISPYINLLRRDTDRRLLYLGIVEPQLQAEDFRRRQQQQIDLLNRRLQSDRAETNYKFQQTSDALLKLEQSNRLKSVETGHPTSFMSRRKYFPRFSK